jgi:hypothetical protein
MSLLSPDVFATALVGVMRLGADGRKAYLESRLLKDEKSRALGKEILSSIGKHCSAPDADLDVAILADAKLRLWAADVATNLRLLDAGAEFAGVFELDTSKAIPEPKTVNGKVVVFDEGRFQALVRNVIERQDQFKKDFRAAQISLAEMQQASWLNTWRNPNGTVAAPSPWRSFALSMLDVSLDVLSAQPGLLGGGRRVQSIVASVVPSIAAAYDPDNKDISSRAHILPAVFAEAAIRTLIDSPHLISSQVKWQRLTTAVLIPLQEQVKNGKVMELFTAEGRIRELLEGPLANAALQVVSDHADDYLKGSAASDRLAGTVIRATLGEYLSLEPETRNVRKVFGNDGIQLLLRHSLAAAADNPALFIRENASSRRDDQARKFLSRAADHIRTNGFPAAMDGVLAAQLMGVAIDAVSEHLLSRVKAGPDSNAQAQMGAEIATFLIRDITAGFRKAVLKPASPGLPAASPLERFGKPQLIAIVKIIAEYAARSPAAFLGEDSNPHVVLVAQTIAETLSLDEDGLLTAEDWQNITLACATAALENPNTLFARAAGGDVNGLIAKRLIGMILTKAKENMSANKDRPGQVLFGRVLSEAIIATLDAASTGVLNIIEDEAKLKEHLAAVEDLVSRLNRLAASRDTALIIGSREWIRIYKHYIADVLHRGQDAMTGLTDAQLLDLIRTKPAIAAIQEDAG